MKLIILALMSLSLFASAPRVTSFMTPQHVAKLEAVGLAAYDYFGASVAVSGDLLVIGSYGDNAGAGSAYLFQFNALTGTYDEMARLSASDGAGGDAFGTGVAISGDIVVVGSPKRDSNGTDSGMLYLFEKSSAGWSDMTETAVLGASDSLAGDYLGYSVAIDGDVVVAGAYGDDTNGSDAGAVYIYEKPSSGWEDMNETVKLTAPDAATGDNFGKSVAISGDSAVIGSHSDDNTYLNAGAAYLFKKNPAGWASGSEVSKFTASDAAAHDAFGNSVAIDGNTVVVGAYNNDDAGTNSGSVYLFQKPLSGWTDSTETAKLTASDAMSGDFFGNSVAIANDAVLVGAHQRDSNVGSNSGAVYFFKKPLAGWSSTTENSRIVANDASAYGVFGVCVAMDGDSAVVGSYGSSANGSFSGAAYALKNTLDINTIENKSTVLDIDAVDDENDTITFSLVEGGDAALFQIDAQSGVLRFKSAPDFEAPLDADSNNRYSFQLLISDITAQSSTYSVNVNVGDIAYEQTAPKALDFGMLSTIQMQTPLDNSVFGTSVAISGDTAVVGASGVAGGAGAVYVYMYDSTTNTYVLSATLTASDAGSSHFFGSSVAISGNSVVVGSYGDNANGTYAGAAYLFEKPAEGWSDATEDVKLVSSDIAAGDYFGISVGISGNLIIIGSKYDDFRLMQNAGSAYLFQKTTFNGAVIASEVAKFITADAANNDNCGESVAISTNLIAIGCTGDDDGGDNSGSIHLFEKQGEQWSGIGEVAKLSASDAAAGDLLGHSVAIDGDIVIGGAYGKESGTGAAYLFEKPDTGWAKRTENAKLTPTQSSVGDHFGESVAISADMVVIGSSASNVQADNAGAAYLFEKPAGGWSTMMQNATLTVPDGMASDNFGFSVAISSTALIAGAPNTGNYVGSAYLFKATQNNRAGIIPTLMYLLN